MSQLGSGVLESKLSILAEFHYRAQNKAPWLSSVERMRPCPCYLAKRCWDICKSPPVSLVHLHTAAIYSAQKPMYLEERGLWVKSNSLLRAILRCYSSSFQLLMSPQCATVGVFLVLLPQLCRILRLQALSAYGPLIALPILLDWHCWGYSNYFQSPAQVILQLLHTQHSYQVRSEQGFRPCDLTAPGLQHLSLFSAKLPLWRMLLRRMEYKWSRKEVL